MISLRLLEILKHEDATCCDFSQVAVISDGTSGLEVEELTVCAIMSSILRVADVVSVAILISAADAGKAISIEVENRWINNCLVSSCLVSNCLVSNCLVSKRSCLVRNRRPITSSCTVLSED
jgi:hypothetical protein